MMTRRMGDAITGNVGALIAAGPWDVVAPYVTGSGIAWTPAQRALFSVPQATIDQGGTGSPVASAMVRDFEQGAWTASQANEEVGNGLWTPARPTIYSDQSNLAPIVADGWRGDLWVAIVGWQPGDAWPAPVQAAIDAGCTVVAVQNAQNVNGTIDTSVVLDPTWPEADPMAVNTQNDWAWCSKCQGLYYGPNQVTSVCPAGAQHAPSAGSFNYALPYSGS